MRKSDFDIVFPQDFDERARFEAESRGYLSGVTVEFANGSRYPLVFWDPVRLQQDLAEDTAQGSPFLAEPGMVVLPKVTVDNVEKAIDKLKREHFFARLQPVEG